MFHGFFLLSFNIVQMGGSHAHHLCFQKFQSDGYTQPDQFSYEAASPCGQTCFAYRLNLKVGLPFASIPCLASPTFLLMSSASVKSFLAISPLRLASAAARFNFFLAAISARSLARYSGLIV